MQRLAKIPYSIVVDVLKRVGFRIVPRGAYLLMEREGHVVVISKRNDTDAYTLGEVIEN